MHADSASEGGARRSSCAPRHRRDATRPDGGPSAEPRAEPEAETRPPEPEPEERRPDAAQAHRAATRSRRSEAGSGTSGQRRAQRHALQSGQRADARANALQTRTERRTLRRSSPSDASAERLSASARPEPAQRAEDGEKGHRHDEDLTEREEGVKPRRGEGLRRDDRPGVSPDRARRGGEEAPSNRQRDVLGRGTGVALQMTAQSSQRRAEPPAAATAWQHSEQPAHVGSRRKWRRVSPFNTGLPSLKATVTARSLAQAAKVVHVHEGAPTGAELKDKAPSSRFRFPECAEQPKDHQLGSRAETAHTVKRVNDVHHVLIIADEGERIAFHRPQVARRGRLSYCRPSERPRCHPAWMDKTTRRITRRVSSIPLLAYC